MIIEKLKQFISWWGENLYRGLPSSFRSLFRVSQPSLNIYMANERLALSWQQDGKRRACGEHTLDSTFDFAKLAKKAARSRNYQLKLELDEKQALHLQHNFPEGVQENIKQVVGYQLDRITPFSLETAYFDAKIARHDKANKLVVADIYVAPKTHIEQHLTKLRALGVPEIDVISALENPTQLTKGIISTTAAPATPSLVPFYFFIMALIASLAVPVLYKERRLGQIDSAIASLQKKASAQIEVRDKLLAAEEALTFIGEKRKTAPVMLDVVEHLSAEIPPHTWIERLEIDGNQVQIRGESEQALSLIDTLEESPHFEAVSFKSPVTRSPSSGKDKFHLQASVEAQHE
ncbi:MAG TPA: PilN domain-containing protein [Thiolinea sp.]|nr:PilN domain-containing protein [Thiolinea sp.]